MHLAAISVNSITNRHLYGVNDVFPLSQLPYFDVTRQLPPDIMHDILGGGAECVLHQVLRGLVSSGLLYTRELSELYKFEYGPNDLKNKRVPVSMAFITGNATLTGTASKNNEDWERLLQYREILDIAFAPEIPAQAVAYLNILVQTFLTEFLLLEFDIFYKKNIADNFARGCRQLCDVVLMNGDDREVATFTDAATASASLHLHSLDSTWVSSATSGRAFG
ncbi:hypothetical protein MTO96_026776 [Rhipicephalus appendiculatus]